MGMLRWGAIVVGALFACVPIVAFAQCTNAEISKAFEMRVMPDFHGCPYATALAYAKRLDPEPGRTNVHSMLDPEIVDHQAPEAGASTADGVSVELYVSIGPEPVAPPPEPQPTPAPPPPAPQPPPPPPVPPPPRETDIGVFGQKTGGGGVKVGVHDTFAFSVSNTGPANADVAVTFEGTNFRIDGAGDAGCGGDERRQSCRIDVGAGTFRTFEVSGAPIEQGDYRVIAMLDIREVRDANRDNNFAEPPFRRTPIIDTPPPVADLSIELSPDNGQAKVGDAIETDAVVTNHGFERVAQVEIRGSTSNLNNMQVSGDCSAIACSIDMLAPGESRRFRIRGAAGDADIAVNLQIVSASLQDPDASNNAATASWRVNAIPPPRGVDVSIGLSPETGSARTGDSISTKVVIRNLGDVRATQVRVTSSIENLQNTNFSGACLALQCEIPSLGPGASAEFTISGDAGTSEVRIDVEALTANDLDGSNNGARGTWTLGGAAPHLTDFDRLVDRYMWLIILVLVLIVATPAGIAARKVHRRRQLRRWLPRVHVDSRAPRFDAPPPDDLPLHAPPISVSASITGIEAYAPEDLDARVEEA